MILCGTDVLLLVIHTILHQASRAPTSAYQEGYAIQGDKGDEGGLPGSEEQPGGASTAGLPLTDGGMFTLDMDASGTAIGAIGQAQNDKERVLAYENR